MAVSVSARMLQLKARGVALVSRRKALGIKRDVLRGLLLCDNSDLIRVEVGIPFPNAETLGDRYSELLSLIEIGSDSLLTNRCEI